MSGGVCGWRRGRRALVTALALMAMAPSCATASIPAGQILAFGVNTYGQLGSVANAGTTNANATPALVALPGATGPVTHVSTGNNHTLAVTATGQLYAFGDNRYGQLGNANGVGSKGANPSPELVALPGATGPVTDTSVGFNFSLALTSTGQLYGFGENRCGQLGNPNNNGVLASNPTPTLVFLPGAEGPVTQIAAGYDFSLAATSSGQLYAFGCNRVGQLGSTANNGNENPNPTPTLVTLPGAEGVVTEVAAGFEFSLVVTSAGELYAFGRNDFGQLGITTNSGVESANPTPTPVTLIEPVAEVSAGSVDSLAVTSSGRLLAFGDNRYGQLGNATNSGEALANPEPAYVSLPGAVGAVASAVAGVSDGVAVTTTGQLYTFGLNEYGELGTTPNVGTTNPNPTPALVSLPPGTAIESAAQGDASQTLVLTTASPTITAARLSHRRFRVGRAPTAISARTTPIGTTLQLSLAAPARLQVAIVRIAPGLRHGDVCVSPTRRLERVHAGRCSRSYKAGFLTRAREPEGADSVTFSGRVGHRALGSGDYRAVLSAENNAGASNAVALGFTIVR
jgi:alpha-tubulin suppressor-like RCC1 family protein